MARFNRRHVFTMPFDVERGSATVEYLVEFEVSPEEPERGPSYSSAGEPGCPASVESKTVYFVGKKTCPACHGVGATVAGTCAKCRGAKRITFRDERPELEDLVDDEELLEYAGDQGGYDGPDTTAEARGER